MFSMKGLVIVISAILYIVLIAGLSVIFSDTFKLVYNRLRMRNRLSAKRKESKAQRGLIKWLRLALQVCLGRDVSPMAFIVTDIAFFLIIFFLCINTFTLISSLMASLTIAGLPWILLWIRLTALRHKGSYEGEQLISDFLRQYRINRYNIFETLEQLVAVKSSLKISRKLLYKLLYELRDTGNTQRIKKATDDFADAIGTNWSLMLAHNIFIAADRGINVSLAIEDILIQLREARALSESRKRLNSEAARMTYLMVPIIYLVTICMAVRFLDLPLRRFIYNQFYTSQGLIFFLLILLLFVFNIALISLVINRKFDY